LFGYIKDSDIAWAAGFLDGEGCFYMQKNKQRGNYYWTPSLTAEQADLRPLEKLQELFGGTIYTRPSRGENRRPTWAWRLGGNEKLAFVLAELEPYLIVKKEKAIEMQERIAINLAKGSRIP